MMAWTKLPSVESIQHCNCCPAKPQRIALDQFVHPGFGSASMYADDADLFHPLGEDDTVQTAEDFALEHGGDAHDWRLVITAPLYDAVYQRQGEGEWVLTHKGQGFAGQYVRYDVTVTVPPGHDVQDTAREIRRVLLNELDFDNRLTVFVSVDKDQFRQEAA